MCFSLEALDKTLKSWYNDNIWRCILWQLFEDLVAKKFTVRRIREEMSVAGYDLSAYDDPYLIRRMLEVDT